MSYIKYGITTKIKLINSNIATDNYIKSCFNLDLYNKNGNSYYLNSSILSNNLKSFRNEILNYSSCSGDSIDNCEAYCLNTSADVLLTNEIVLVDNHEKYFFSNDKYFKFETDQVFIVDGLVALKLYLIPIFWDINRVEFENFITVANFINKLVRASTSNILKGASFFVVV